MNFLSIKIFAQGMNSRKYWTLEWNLSKESNFLMHWKSRIFDKAFTKFVWLSDPLIIYCWSCALFQLFFSYLCFFETHLKSIFCQKKKIDSLNLGKLGPPEKTSARVGIKFLGMGFSRIAVTYKNLQICFVKFAYLDRFWKNDVVAVEWDFGLRMLCAVWKLAIVPIVVDFTYVRKTFGVKPLAPDLIDVISEQLGFYSQLHEICGRTLQLETITRFGALLESSPKYA